MYYPDQRYASPLTIIRREVLLPDEALGTVRITEGKRVDIRDVVANGVMPSRHIIIDALAYFGLSKPDDLIPYMQVEQGDVVEERDLLAGKNPKRGRRLFSPVRGIVALIDKGRIFLQQMPQVVDLEAGVRGRVAKVTQGRGVVIEAVGAQVQGVWGNNRRTIGTLRAAPEEGLEAIGGDEFDLTYKGAVVLSTQPLTISGLRFAAERGFIGLIAPSMDYALKDAVMDINCAVLLLEGFGSMRMSRAVYNLLAQLAGQQVMLDAYMPNRWESHFPEAIINLTAKAEERPSRPNAMLSLRTGMTIRVTRDPYAGQTGNVLNLPKTPTLMENGLRVMCAQVELVAGERVFLPLTNLEVLGR